MIKSIKGRDLQMNYDVVLKKLENNEISSEDALKELYPVKKQKMGKRAFFVKMKVTIPDEGKGLNTFLKVLFAIPIPIIFATMGLRFGGRFIKDDNIEVSEIIKMLKYSKHSVIDIDAKDAQIQIKVL